jgi:hypothetical protein
MYSTQIEMHQTAYAASRVKYGRTLAAIVFTARCSNKEGLSA